MLVDWRIEHIRREVISSLLTEGIYSTMLKEIKFHGRWLRRNMRKHP